MQWRARLPVLVCLVLLQQAAPVRAAPFVLITEDEAKLPPAPSAPERAFFRGPEIIVESPIPGRSITSPIRLRIIFKSRGGVPVDTESIELRYLRTPVVPLTSRVKDYVKAGGILIQEASVPPGQHTVQIIAKDEDERETKQTFTFTVVAK
jgi:hypothetical protein